MTINPRFLKKFKKLLLQHSSIKQIWAQITLKNKLS
jgi:hypothetical protein